METVLFLVHLIICVFDFWLSTLSLTDLSRFLYSAYHGHVSSAWDISPYKWEFKNPQSQPDFVHIVPCPDLYRGKYRDRDFASTRAAKDAYVGEVKAVCDERNAAGGKIGTFIAESLQSCGGQIVYPPGYLRDVYR